ncbi:MAG: T9SS type A sorting domain-containing protein [Candidatus Zixiibacteriota bacterium]
MKKLIFISILIIPTILADLITISDEPGLQDAIWSIESGDTVFIENGDYHLTNFLGITGGVSNVAVIGESRDGVQIIGPGMANEDYGDVWHLFAIMNARYVYLADMTLREVYYHPIIVQSENGAWAPHFENLHIIDAGEQFIKVTAAAPPTTYCDSGIVENCHFEFTDRARHWYTNGVDILATEGWIIRNNLFERIRGPIGILAGPTILAWQNSIGTIVEGNVMIECDIGISMGNSGGPGDIAREGETVYDNQNPIVRNNFFYREGDGDVGITLNRCRNGKVYNNTVIQNGTFPWNIEYRFTETDCEIYCNLTDGPVFLRDGASGDVSGNIDYAELSWFSDASSGDLHILDATPPVDAGFTIAEVPYDIDGQSRPWGELPDVGADEYSLETEIEENVSNKKKILQIYPNPASDYLIIDSEAIIQGEVSIYGIDGELVLKQRINRKILLPENLKNGLFIIEISYEDEKIVKKLCKY